MSDLISREALLEDLRLDLLIKGELNYDEVKDLITNAPVVSGDVVAYGIPNSSISGMKHCLMSVRLDIPSDDQYGGAMWIPLYTNPQQPQSVADALEDAAKICDELAEQDYCVDVRVASEAIRTLIKRNAKEGE